MEASLLLADVLVPDVRMLCNVAFKQFAAGEVVEVDHLDAVFAQPVEAAREGAAFAHYERANAKLPDETAAIPAGRERSDHNEVAIAFLAASAAEGIGFAMHAGVALLHPPVMPAAHEFAIAGEERGSDGDAALNQAIPRLFQCHCQHLLV